MSASRRPLRIALIAVAAVLMLGVGAVAVVIALFDPNAYKPDIMQAVKRATGRELALNGKISLKPSLWPTIQVADVALANPLGFSRPQMASLQGMELQLGLVPLLSRRIEIERLVLIRPDILLETDAGGHANWEIKPEASPSAPAGTEAPGQAAEGRAKTVVSVGSVRIQDGVLAYRDGRSGKVTTLGLPKLDAVAASPDSPLHVKMDANYNGTVFTVVGDTGSLSRLQDPAATSPWPVKLGLIVGQTSLAMEGSLTHPLQGKGYDLAVNLIAPDAAALAPVLQGVSPPKLRDVRVAAKVADKGGAWPEVGTLAAHVGSSDLGEQVPGLLVDSLDVTGAADQPLKIEGVGKFRDQPLSLAMVAGTLGSLMPGAKPVAFPVDATVQAAGATLTVKGSVADAQALRGGNLAVAVRIPDLAALSAFARRPLPALKQVVFQGTVTDTPGGFRSGAILHSFALTGGGSDLSGDVAVSLAAKTVVAAVLASNRIDLDMVQAGMDHPPEGGAGAGAPGAAPGDAGKAEPGGKRHERLFSDRKIPFNLLRSMDADLKLAVGDVHSGGVDYKAVDVHAVVKDGKLAVAPFAADVPGGHLSGSLAVDAGQEAPPVHVTLRAPGLALTSILAAVRQPSYANGNLEVYADLRGAGDTPHAIAASLDGSVGLAMAGGSIDNRLLGSVLGKVMETFNALNLVGKGGTSEVKCLAARMDARHGVGQLGALVLRSSLLTMTGSGSVNLGDETLTLGLHPQARIAGSEVVIPVSVTGPIRSPAIGVNKLGAAEANAGTVAGAVIGNATPLGIVGGLLGDRSLSGGGTDICPPALAIARAQTAPDTMAAKPAAPNTLGSNAANPNVSSPNPGNPNAGNPTVGNPNVGAILKNLFR